MMDKPIAYKGDGNYIFVSYSHDDSDIVLHDIKVMISNRCRVFYDEAFFAGQQWDAEAFEKIVSDKCIGVIFYLSKKSILSDPIKNELEYAKTSNTQFFSVNIGNKTAFQLYKEIEPELDEISKKTVLGIIKDFPNSKIHIGRSSDSKDLTHITELIENISRWNVIDAPLNSNVIATTTGCNVDKAYLSTENAQKYFNSFKKVYEDKSITPVERIRLDTLRHAWQISSERAQQLEDQVVVEYGSVKESSDKLLEMENEPNINVHVIEQAKVKAATLTKPIKHYFTHYWANATCDKYSYKEGELIGSTAASSKRITLGDAVYIVTIIHGKLYLIGRMTVGCFCGVEDAKQLLQSVDLWESEQYLIADKSTPIRYSNKIPDEVTQQLLFVSESGRVSRLTYEKPHILDRQTLRGIRELTMESALFLDKFLPEDQVVKLALNCDDVDGNIDINKKDYVSIESHFEGCMPELLGIFGEFKNQIMALGSDINVYACKYYIGFKSKKLFLQVRIRSGKKIHITTDYRKTSYEIWQVSDIEPLMDMIRKSYLSAR